MQDPTSRTYKRWVVAHSLGLAICALGQYGWAVANTLSGEGFDWGIPPFALLFLSGILGIYAGFSRRVSLTSAHISLLGTSIGGLVAVYGAALGASPTTPSNALGGGLWLFAGGALGLAVASLSSVSDDVPPSARISPFLARGKGSSLPSALMAEAAGVGAVGATLFAVSCVANARAAHPSNLHPGVLAYPPAMLAALTGSLASTSRSVLHAQIHLALLLFAAVAGATGIVLGMADSDVHTMWMNVPAAKYALLPLWILGAGGALWIAYSHVAYVRRRSEQDATLRLLQ